MFSIFQQDATNTYNYKKDLFNAVMSIASKDQDRQLQLADKENDRKYQEQQSMLNIGNQIALKAAENGASAAVLSRIAETSKQEGANIGSILGARRIQ
jgi:hypothetical protein